MRTPPRAYQRRHRRERRPTRSVARTGSWTRSFPAPRRWSAGCTRQGGTATTPNGRGHSLDHDELGHGAEALRLHYRYVDAACDPTAACVFRVPLDPVCAGIVGLVDHRLEQPGGRIVLAELHSYRIAIGDLKSPWRVLLP